VRQRLEETARMLNVAEQTIEIVRPVAGSQALFHCKAIRVSVENKVYITGQEYVDGPFSRSGGEFVNRAQLG
jgi:hypothetical protein